MVLAKAGLMVKSNQPRQNKRITRIRRLLERARTPFVPVIYRHNKVELYPDGSTFFNALLESLRTAEKFILLEYYIFRDDSTGRGIAVELIEAIQRGVRVFLVYDYIGCVDTPSSFFRFLAQEGVNQVAFNVPSIQRGIRWFDKRDHRKMAIIDDRVAFLGGFNIGDEYSGVAEGQDRFRDIGFSVDGAVVRELISIFQETWQMEAGGLAAIPALAIPGRSEIDHGDANVAIVSGGPHHRSSYIRNAFLVNIASASEELLVVNPSFVPGPRVIRALLRAARRGIRVRLLLPARSDIRVMQIIGRSSYGTLLRGGVEIYEFEGEILHAKVMLVDDERTIIGSANLDQRSFHRNFEINAIIDSIEFSDQIRVVLENDLQKSGKITLEHHENRGFLLRVLEKVVNLFGWFL